MSQARKRTLARLAVTGLFSTVIAGAAMTAAAQPASASNYYYCGYNLSYCSHEHGVYARYYWVSPIYYNSPDCTAPGGCMGGYYFYYG